MQVNIVRSSTSSAPVDRLVFKCFGQDTNVSWMACAQPQNTTHNTQNKTQNTAPMVEWKDNEVDKEMYTFVDGDERVNEWIYGKWVHPLIVIVIIILIGIDTGSNSVTRKSTGLHGSTGSRCFDTNDKKVFPVEIITVIVTQQLSRSTFLLITKTMGGGNRQQKLSART
jgi:hypothetical protein